MLALKKITATVFGAACILAFGANADAQGSCTALLSHQNDLWLAQPNGTIISRVTSDARLKPAVALNPAGSVVAYSTQDPSRHLVLVDGSGRILDYADLHTDEPVVNLQWITSTTLRAGVHLSPGSSHFHFFTFMAGRLSRNPTLDASGGDCAASPKSGRVACTTADAVTLAGDDLYYSAEAFAGTTPIQTANLALGTSVLTNTTPPLRVEFKSQSASTVTLRVTRTDNNWSEQRVLAGATMPISLTDEATIIGLEPIRTSDPHTIKLQVRKSASGKAGFEGNVAWDPSGKRLAVVEADASGQRTWILLNQEMGKAAISGNGAIDARIKLPIAGPIVALKFISDTKLRIDGSNQAVVYDIPANGKVRSPVHYSVERIPARPLSINARLNGVLANAIVRDWSCQ